MVEHGQRVAVVTERVEEVRAVLEEREQLVGGRDDHPRCLARMMLSALPAWNHSICSGLNVCVHSKSMVEPSGFVMRHCTFLSGARSARPSTEILSSSPMRS